MQNSTVIRVAPAEGVVRDPHDQTIIDRHARELASGAVFRNHAAGTGSRFGYHPILTRRAWADSLRVLADMAAQSDPLAQVAAFIVGRVNLYGDEVQAAQKVWAKAEEALAAGYEDVVLGASPEPGRYSDRRRDYTLRERVVIECWLSKATAPFERGAGIGWCTAALVRDLGINPWEVPTWETK